MITYSTATLITYSEELRQEEGDRERDRDGDGDGEAAQGRPDKSGPDQSWFLPRLGFKCLWDTSDLCWVRDTSDLCWVRDKSVLGLAAVAEASSATTTKCSNFLF